MQQHIRPVRAGSLSCNPASRHSPGFSESTVHRHLDPFEAAWFFEPAEGPGGDLIVVRSLDQGQRLFVLVADAMGHGEQAALLASLLRDEIDGLLQEGVCLPGAVLMHLNSAVQAFDPEMFATAAVCLLDASHHSAAYALAGHPPILACDDSGEVCQLTHAFQPLGISADLKYRSKVIPYHPDTTLLLYTDGVTDALPGIGKTPIAHLTDLVEGAANLDHLPDFLQDLVRFSASAHDDRSLLAVRYPLVGSAPSAEVISLPACSMPHPVCV